MSDHPNLTAKGIELAIDKADASEELRLHDGKCPGLVLWRRPNGTPRWYLFRRVGGRKVRYPLAEPSDFPAITLEMARDIYPDIAARVAKGEDLAKTRREARVKGQAERKQAIQVARGGKVPLADVLEHIQTRMDTRDRSPRHTAERQRIGKALIAVGLKDLCDPGACAIAEKWINSQKCGDLTKHRYGQHVRAIGNAALKKWDDLPKDPFRNLEVGSRAIPPPAMFELDELAKLASDAALASDWGRLFAFLLLTGCRYREGAYARWSRIDLDNATYSILPPTKEEREAGEAVKRGKGRTVTLQAELVALLRDWPKLHGDFLFAGTTRITTGDTTVAFRDHCAALGITIGERHIHTLRHSHVALSVACGVQDMQLRLSVGHGGPEMTAHYANAAMLWRGKLKDWRGTFRLRDAAELARLNITLPAAKKVAQ
jgi:integrase